MPDGLIHREMFTGPVFFEKAPGVWVPTDPTLRLDATSRVYLPTRADHAAATFAAQMDPDAPVVSLGGVGPSAVRHPDASATVPATVEGRSAVYADALSGGRDLRLTAVIGGFEESVIVPDANAPASYRTVFDLPAGVSAGQDGAGVEFRNSAGEIVGRFGGGLAWDSADLPAETPVTVTLVTVDGSSAVVETAVDPAWLNADRVYPITVDPTYSSGPSDSCPTTGSTYSGCDTYTNSDNYDSNSGTGYYQNAELRMGSSGSWQEGSTTTRSDTRTYVKFATDSLGSGDIKHEVTSAEFTMDAYDSRGYTDPRYYNVYVGTGHPTRNTVWNNQPAQGSLISDEYHGGTGTMQWSVRSAVNAWFTGAATNYGLMVRAEPLRDMTSFKQLRSWNSGYSTAPKLTAVYSAKAPTSPKNVSASTGDSSATVNWSQPDYDGASAVTGYVVEWRRADGTSLGSTTVGSSVRSHTVTGLTNGVGVYFRVIARNSVGDSAAAVSATVVPKGKPGAPTSVSATPGPQSATLTWAAPTSDGGSAITGYAIETRRALDNVVLQTATASGSARSHTSTGLANGTGVYFTIRSQNVYGDSPTVTSNTVTPASPPGAPTGVQATAGDQRATVTWSPPTDDGGSPVASYTVELRYTNGNGLYSTDTVSSITRTHTKTGLLNGTTYYFVVIANSANGASPGTRSNDVLPAPPPAQEPNVPILVSPAIAYTFPAEELPQKFRVETSDPQADRYQAEVQLRAANGASVTSAVVMSPAESGQQSEGSAFPPLLEGRYEWRARACDVTEAHNCSLYTSWRAFQVGAALRPSSGTNTVGLEDFYAYEHWNTGAGTAYANTSNGNLVLQETDLEVPGPLNLRLTRTYNVLREEASGPLGKGWTLGIAEGEGMADALLDAVLSLDVDRMVQVIGNEDMFEIFDADGTTHHFAKGGTAAQGWQSPPGVNLTLTDGFDATAKWYRATRPDGVRYEFRLVDNSYRLVRISDRAGNALTLTYSGGKLIGITDGVRTLTFTWSGDHVSLARYTGGGQTHDVAYSVDATSKRLTSVTQAANSSAARTRSFGYTPASLASVTDGRGNVTRFVVSNGRLTGVTDRAGKNWTVGYDATCGTEIPARTLTCVTDPLGETRTWTLDAATGNPVAFQDEGDVDESNNRRRNRRTFVYAANRLQRSVDPVGNVTDYEYNELGQISRQQFTGVGEAPAISQFVYRVTDGAGDLTEARTGVGTPDARIVSFAYDGDGKGLMTTQTDAAGAATMFSYHPNGLLRSITNPLGRTTTYGDATAVGHGYHFTGQPLKITDASGMATTLEYDPMGRLVKRVDRAGKVWSMTYDARGNLLAAANPLGHVSRSCYDENDNRILAIRPMAPVVTCGQAGTAPHVTAYSYDARDSLTMTETNSDGQARKTLNGYAADGELIETLHPRSFDPVTRQLLSGSALQKTTYVLHPNGRVAAVIDPEGARTDVLYTANGLARRVTEPSNSSAGTRRTITTTYNGRGQETAILVSGHTKPTRHEYNVHGERTRTTTPVGRVTGVGYDRAGRVIAETDAQGRVTDRFYDAAGNLIRVRQPGEQNKPLVTEYGYTDRGEPAWESDPADPQRFVHYGYDAEGRQNRREERINHNVARVFESRFGDDGRVLEETATVPGQTAGSRRVVYTHDGNRNLSKVSTYLDGAASPNVAEIEVTYTTAEEPKTWSETLFTPAGTPVTKSTTYGYERDGALVSRIVNGRATSHEHYRNGLEKRTSGPIGAPVVTSGWNQDGSPSTRVVSGALTTTMAYDIAGRLTSKVVQNATGLTVSSWQQVSYDDDDYRLGEAATQVQPDGTTLAGAATYSYDATGKLISSKHPFEPIAEAYALDDAGNIVQDDTYSYEYEFNRLLGMDSVDLGGEFDVDFAYNEFGDVIEEGGPGLAPTTTFTYDAASHPRRTTLPDGAWVEYAYDAWGRMVRRHDSAGKVELFFHEQDSQTLAMETDGSGSAVTEYLLDATGTPVAQWQPASGWGVYVTDLRDNLTQLVSGSGSVVAVYGYDPFGQLEPTLTKSSGGWDSRLRYQMAPRDPKTGVYTLGPRLYDPKINRFLGADYYASSAANIDLALDPLTGNRYLYAGANPAGLVDNGHHPEMIRKDWHFHYTYSHWYRIPGVHVSGAAVTATFRLNPNAMFPTRVSCQGGARFTVGRLCELHSQDILTPNGSTIPMPGWRVRVVMVSEIGWEFETEGFHFAGERARIRFTFVNHPLTGELWLNVHAHGPTTRNRALRTLENLRGLTKGIWWLMARNVGSYYR